MRVTGAASPSSRARHTLAALSPPASLRVVDYDPRAARQASQRLQADCCGSCSAACPMSDALPQGGCVPGSRASQTERPWHSTTSPRGTAATTVGQRVTPRRATNAGPSVRRPRHPPACVAARRPVLSFLGGGYRTTGRRLVA